MKPPSSICASLRSVFRNYPELPPRGVSLLAPQNAC
uniref:Uncharacterized protein n=1 Tax=Anguilla anguilla TaxID=7936 RepID=A0A0E9U6S2_ANGAN